MYRHISELWGRGEHFSGRERFEGRFAQQESQRFREEAHPGEGDPRERANACSEAGERFRGPHAEYRGGGCGERFHGGARRGGEFEGRGRHGWRHGFGGRGPGDFEGAFGHGRGRMFDAGDIKLVVMKLLAEQPSYGYQLIKMMEERLAGGYTPSAGVIYPTLTMLEEEGLATSTTENNKKVYSVTAEGTQYLEENKERVEELFSRIDDASRHFERGRSPELMKAFMNLRGAVMAKVARGNATREQIRKMAEAINATAKTVDEL